VSLAPLGRRAVEVISHRAVGAYAVLSCADPDGPAPGPGQFYMLAAVERWGGGEDERPFLPRAFSVLRHRDACRDPSPGGGADAPGVPDGRRTLEFLLEVVGPGTARLAELRPGDGLWLAGPFGHGFAPPGEGRRPLLVGGGVGIAPLAIWQDYLRGAPALIGFRDAAHTAGADLLAGARVATDDGSVGHQGPVTDLLAAELGRDARAEVYACGPPAMLEAVRALCADLAVPAQLALESGMACGYGACFGCVVPTRRGLVRLCLDGPVLDAAELEVRGEAGDERSEAE
jgi:dihydroorotate dehydrogenase electron transfer subunit